MQIAAFDENTSGSLIGALRSTNDYQSWSRFVAIYEPMLHRWLRCRGLPEFLIPDVVGDVYVKLVGHMPNFLYDERRSFRGWLRTVAENAASDAEKRAWNRFEKTVDFQDSAIAARCSSQLFRRANDELDGFVEEMEERMQVANSVVRKVKGRINAKTWQAFYLTEVEGNSCEDAALKLRMKPGSVYVARFRVKNYLREEAEAITGA